MGQRDIKCFQFSSLSRLKIFNTVEPALHRHSWDSYMCALNTGYSLETGSDIHVLCSNS